MDEMSSQLLSQLKEPSITPSLPHQYLHIDPNWKPFTSEQLRQIEIAHEIANEVDVLLLAEVAIEQGKNVWVPKVINKSENGIALAAGFILGLVLRR